jgi:hypothetical protein
LQWISFAIAHVVLLIVQLLKSDVVGAIANESTVAMPSSRTWLREKDSPVAPLALASWSIPWKSRLYHHGDDHDDDDLALDPFASPPPRPLAAMVLQPSAFQFASSVAGKADTYKERHGCPNFQKQHCTMKVTTTTSMQC